MLCEDSVIMFSPLCISVSAIGTLKVLCPFLSAGFNSCLFKSEDSCVIALERQNVLGVGWAAISYFCTNFLSLLMLLSTCHVSRS